MGEEPQNQAPRAEVERAATARALARLFLCAETGQAAQNGALAHFLACVHHDHDFAFDWFELHAVEVALSDDMLTCLDRAALGRGGPLRAGGRR